MQNDLPKQPYYPRTTLQSSDSNWSQEREVFYYSNFDLFTYNNAEQQFYQFSSFVEKVATELGKEWQREANYLYQPYITSNRVFMTLMEMWLSQHPPTSNYRNMPKLTPFNPKFTTRFHQKVLKQIQLKHPEQNIQPPSTSLKAVCLGFYMTANETWEDLFQSQATTKPEPFKRSLIREVTSAVQDTFRPLMVISQKISNVFGRKKRKYNEQIMPDQSDNSKFDSCYHEFRKTLDIGKQLQRKMSDLDLDLDLEEGKIEQEGEEKKKVIEKKQFVEEQAPIKGTLLNNVYNYVTGFIQRNTSWQVASYFVTQILEMNQVRLEEGKKVKVMRPAEDFYQKLVMAWLMFQKRGQTSPQFTEYLNCLKTAFFGDKWHQRYLIPTKFFYERMREDWQHLTTREDNHLKSQKQVLSAFIKLIRKGMKREWDQKMQLNNPC